jgi:hypothetical protein
MHSLQSPMDKNTTTTGSVRNVNVVLTNDNVSELSTKLNVDVKEYQVDRYYADPPQFNQKISLVSFIPSSGASPDQDGIFGMMKVRGVYATEEEANERSEYLIRNVDSYHEIFHCHVGRPFPITTENKFAQSVKSIDIRKKTTELISEDILNKKREEKNEMVDMQEREKKLLEESKNAQEGKAMDVFDEYVTMNVKRAQLLWTYKETMEKLNTMKDSYTSAVDRIKELDVENPEFQNEYKEKYFQARRDAGIPDEKNSWVEFLGVDIDTEWDNFKGEGK